MMANQKDILEFFEKTVENDGYRLDNVEGLTSEFLHDRLLRFFLLGVGVSVGSITMTKEDADQGASPDCTSMGCYEGPECSCACHSDWEDTDDGQD